MAPIVAKSAARVRVYLVRPGQPVVTDEVWPVDARDRCSRGWTMTPPDGVEVPVLAEPVAQPITAAGMTALPLVTPIGAPAVHTPAVAPAAPVDFEQPVTRTKQKKR